MVVGAVVGGKPPYSQRNWCMMQNNRVINLVCTSQHSTADNTAGRYLVDRQTYSGLGTVGVYLGGYPVCRCTNRYMEL